MNITVELRVGAMFRRTCLYCGKESDKSPVQARVHEDGEGTSFVVCFSCLQLTPQDLELTILDTAAWHVAQGRALEALAANPPALPTENQWRDANDAEVLDHSPSQGNFR